MNKDYIKEFNEIEEQILEQQETINDIKVQVKGQVEELEKEDLKKESIKKKGNKAIKKTIKKGK